MKNQLYTLLHEIYDSFTAGFFLNPDYEKEYDNFLRTKYPWKYDNALTRYKILLKIFKKRRSFKYFYERDFKKALFKTDSSEKFDGFDDFLMTDSSIKENHTIDEEKYIHKEEFPDLNRFIYFWYDNPVEKNYKENGFMVPFEVSFDEMIIQKITRFEELIKTVIPEYQKAIIQILLPNIKLIGENDLYFLKRYFRSLDETTFQMYYDDMVLNGERAARIIKENITQYFFNLVLSKKDERDKVSMVVYVGIMAGLGLVKYGRDYKAQAKGLVDLVENHEVFEHIRLPEPKIEINLDTIETYIKEYFSENKTRFEGKNSKIILENLEKMKGYK